MTSTPEGLVLTGIALIEDPKPDDPPFYRAAILRDGEWARLPDAEIIGWNPQWSFTAGRVLNASIDSADGGETNNWGRSYPSGGMLNPESGRWTELPDVPRRRGAFSLFAAGDRYATAHSGWVYDAEEARWLALAFPGEHERTEQAAAFVGDQLFVFGGHRWEGQKPLILMMPGYGTLRPRKEHAAAWSLPLCSLSSRMVAAGSRISLSRPLRLGRPPSRAFNGYQC